MPTPRARRRRAAVEVVLVSAMLVATQWYNDDRREDSVRKESNARANDLAAEQAARSLEACRVRNTGNELGRRNDEAILAGAAAGSERTAQFIEENIRPNLNGPAEMDRDCNADGMLTADEYEDGAAPTGTPIRLPLTD